MFCQNCGAKVGDKAVFCSGCGVKLPPLVSAPYSEKAVKTPVAEQKVTVSSLVKVAEPPVKEEKTAKPASEKVEKEPAKKQKNVAAPRNGLAMPRRQGKKVRGLVAILVLLFLSLLAYGVYFVAEFSDAMYYVHRYGYIDQLVVDCVVTAAFLAVWILLFLYVAFFYEKCRCRSFIKIVIARQFLMTVILWAVLFSFNLRVIVGGGVLYHLPVLLIPLSFLGGGFERWSFFSYGIALLLSTLANLRFYLMAGGFSIALGISNVMFSAAIIVFAAMNRMPSRYLTQKVIKRKKQYSDPAKALRVEKDLFDFGMISQEEYDENRMKILLKMR